MGDIRKDRRRSRLRFYPGNLRFQGSFHGVDHVSFSRSCCSDGHPVGFQPRLDYVVHRGLPAFAESAPLVLALVLRCNCSRSTFHNQFLLRRIRPGQPGDAAGHVVAFAFIQLGDGALQVGDGGVGYRHFFSGIELVALDLLVLCNEADPPSGVSHPTPAVSHPRPCATGQVVRSTRKALLFFLQLAAGELDSTFHPTQLSFGF